LRNDPENENVPLSRFVTFEPKRIP
jgi:hypothetical protein